MTRSRYKIAIVGSGFAGIGMATKLLSAGETNFVVLEKSNQVGGTWRDNTYPGAACDVPSHLYSFAGIPNSSWSRSFSPQPEIQEYLVRCAKDQGVLDKTRFGCQVSLVEWNEADCLWTLSTSQGTLEAKFLVLATGALSEPSIPQLSGIEKFLGKTFHSASWDHSYDLTHKRVAVVGTGASAIQFVPQIAPVVDKLYLMQRTPPWIMPRTDRKLTRIESLLFKKVPLLQRTARSAIYWARELFVVGFAFDRRVMKIGEKIALRHLYSQVKSQELRDKLTPSYTLGCKRVLISSDYYPSLERPNVVVETSGIQEINPTSITTQGGDTYEVDAIIFGTGFHVTDLPVAEFVVGRDGVNLREAWKEGMHAHKGTCVPGFPNLFFLVGPNTGLGHTSQVFMIECQINYVQKALKEMDSFSEKACLEVEPDAEQTWNDKVQEMLKGTVWTSGGCQSWYLDEFGRNTTLWPRFTWQFWLETRNFDMNNYKVS